MDRYTKVVLTISAIALCAIAVKIYLPNIGPKEGIWSGSPTIGDLMALEKMEEGKKRDDAYQKIVTRIPLVQSER